MLHAHAEWLDFYSLMMIQCHEIPAHISKLEWRGTQHTKLNNPYSTARTVSGISPGGRGVLSVQSPTLPPVI